MSRVIFFYSILMGVLLLGTWVVLIATNQFINYDTKPFEALMLLAAEVLTGATLIVGGCGSLAGRTWGEKLNLASLGMLQYTIVYSIGVFGQAGIWPAAIWFITITPLTACAIVYRVSAGSHADKHDVLTSREGRGELSAADGR